MGNQMVKRCNVTWGLYLNSRLVLKGACEHIIFIVNNILVLVLVT